MTTGEGGKMGDGTVFNGDAVTVSDQIRQHLPETRPGFNLAAVHIPLAWWALCMRTTAVSQLIFMGVPVFPHNRDGVSFEYTKIRPCPACGRPK